MKGYVVIVLSGYNHEVEPSPLRIYVGKKGVDASGKKLSKRANGKDKFLGSNGLLYGKIYGLALKNSDFAKLGISKIDTSDKMMDTYLQNKDAPDTFKAIFFPTSYQWKGFDKPVAIKDTQMLLWSKASEQPKDFTYFVGDSKAEHSAVDPDVDKQRFVQNMTYSGAILAFDLTNFTEEIKEANGDLPKSVAVDVTRIVGAYDGSLRLEVGRRGRTIEGSTAAVWKDGKAKTTAPDGLQWIKASDADVLIVDEDSGNELGERKFALLIDPKTLKLKRPNQGYFLAMAGGKKNPRAAAKASAYGGTFSKATSAEFSGSWDISALVAKKPNGKFYTINELHGVGEYMIQKSLPLSQHTMLSVVQSKGESRGVLAKYQADQGGQIFIFNLNIPVH